MHFLCIKWLAIYFLLTIPVLNIFAGTFTDSQGVVYTYSGSTASVTSYTGSLSSSVTIPNSINVSGTNYTVTSISNNALRDASYITAVTISGSVTSIGPYAFYSCVNLTIVTMLEGVTTIGSNAFERCRSLVTVNFPASIAEIDNVAFRLTMQLYPSITFNFYGARPTTIGSGVFDFNHGIVNYPSSQTSWSGYHFTGSNILTYNAISYDPTPTLTFTTPLAASVFIGSTLTNAATSSIPSGGAITYSSATTSVATVSSSGVVTGISSGTSVITATHAAQRRVYC